MRERTSYRVGSVVEYLPTGSILGELRWVWVARVFPEDDDPFFVGTHYNDRSIELTVRDREVIRVVSY